MPNQLVSFSVGVVTPTVCYATIEVWSSVAKCSLIIPLFHTNIRIIRRIIRRLAIPRKYPG